MILRLEAEFGVEFTALISFAQNLAGFRPIQLYEKFPKEYSDPIRLPIAFELAENNTGSGLTRCLGFILKKITDPV